MKCINCGLDTVKKVVRVSLIGGVLKTIIHSECSSCGWKKDEIKEYNGEYNKSVPN